MSLQCVRTQSRAIRHVSTLQRALEAVGRALFGETEERRSQSCLETRIAALEQAKCFEHKEHRRSAFFSTTEAVSTSADLTTIVDMLPSETRQTLLNNPDLERLIEVVMDLGRKPKARFPDGDIILSEDLITPDHLQDAQKKVGAFGKDNRAGINETLHRISCMRDRSGKMIMGLTCRVGRDIPGSAELIDDIVRQGKSILLLGAPGSGKTTAIRTISRILADQVKKRVVIVDTSNEIAGDGHVPHAAVGSSRRLQVPKPDLQHKVMIEAVENHTPEVIVIDEIATFEECTAAQSIARRGVQLIASAHGKRLADLLEDPVLRNLMGGTQAVVVGDKAARKEDRGFNNRQSPFMRKTAIERKTAPAFDIVVEMSSRSSWIVYTDVTRAVDALLAGAYPPCEQRRITESGEMFVMKCDEDPFGLIRNVILPLCENEVPLGAINCDGYSGEGDMYPDMVVRILHETTCEAILQVKEGAGEKAVFQARNKALTRLHVRSSRSEYAQVAFWKVLRACNTMVTKIKEREFE